MNYLGDFAPAATIRSMWNSSDSNGASITRSTNGTISVYKDGGTTQSTAGVTDTEDFDSLTGVHLVAIDTSADGTFYSAGSDFVVVLSAATIDTRTVNAALFQFSLNNRTPLRPTTAGRTLDVSAGGEAGVDWANVGSPTTTLGLSGTTVGVVTDLADGAINAATLAADTITAAKIAADAITDAKVASDVTIASVTGSVGSVATGGIASSSFAAGAIDAAAIAANAIGASELAADAVTEIQSGLSTLDAAGIRTAVGLASANLDTQLFTIVGYIDTEVASILAAVDTEVAAIKAKTDLIPGTTDGKTFSQLVTLIAAVLLGKASGLDTTTAIYRAIDDSKARVTATVDADGNRSAVTLDAS